MSEDSHKSKVITVTLNPFLDRTLVVHFLATGYNNWTAEPTHIDPSGGGIGISRALHSLGVETHAIVLVGHDATGRAYQTLLAEEEFPISIILREGYTCSRIIIKDTGNSNETTIWEDGTGVNQQALQDVASTLEELINPDDVVVFAGGLPSAVQPDVYAWLISIAKANGAQVTVHTEGEPLERALKAGPDLVYLTLIQVEGMFNYPCRVTEDVIHCAQQVRKKGAGEVLISMNDALRAIIAAEEGVWMADWKKEEDGTQTGWSEAMLGGYLADRLDQCLHDKALSNGLAAAKYVVSQIGQKFGSRRDVVRQTQEIEVVSIDDVAAV